jgi:hypothetical protein
MVNTRNNNCNG